MTDEDRELLKLAASAAELELDWETPPGLSERARTRWLPWVITGTGEDRGPAYQWNPLADDGQALQLAGMLRIAIRLDDPAAVCAGWSANQKGAPTLDGRGPWFWKEWHHHDMARAERAMRRAIVTAAAALKQQKLIRSIDNG